MVMSAVPSTTPSSAAFLLNFLTSAENDAVGVVPVGRMTFMLTAAPSSRRACIAAWPASALLWWIPSEKPPLSTRPRRFSLAVDDRLVTSISDALPDSKSLMVLMLPIAV